MYRGIQNLVSRNSGIFAPEIDDGVIKQIHTYKQKNLITDNNLGKRVTYY